MFHYLSDDSVQGYFTQRIGVSFSLINFVTQIRAKYIVSIGII